MNQPYLPKGELKMKQPSRSVLPGALILPLILTACGGDCLQLSGCDAGSTSGTATIISSASNSTSDAVSTPSASSAPSASSTFTPFSKQGTGDTVFTLPATVKVIKITASYQGFSSSFFVDIAGDSVVTESIGTGQDSTEFSGIYSIDGGGLVEITRSAGVSWSIDSVQL